MKKQLVCALTLVLLLSSCGEEESPDFTYVNPSIGDKDLSEEVIEMPDVEQAPNNGSKWGDEVIITTPPPTSPSPSAPTQEPEPIVSTQKKVGTELASRFEALTSPAYATSSVQEIATDLTNNAYITFALTRSDVAPGQLYGFGSTETYGFTEGVLLSSSDPLFLLYILEAEEWLTADGLCESLRYTVDYSIGIEHTLTRSSGDKAFILLY